MSHGSEVIIGVDVGDDRSSVCVLDATSGEVVARTSVRTRARDFGRLAGRYERARVVLEVGTHSPWLSRLFDAAGHEVIVANARQVRLIYGSRRKNDRLDAEKLARLARLDVALLAPVQHRGEQGQADLALVRARDALVRSRTALINHVRGAVKSFGTRIPACNTAAFHKVAAQHLPPALLPALQPLLESIERTTAQVRAYEQSIHGLCQNAYPQSSLLTQVHGVAELTGLRYLLTLEDPARFTKSRQVGAFLGLAPGQRQSAQFDPTCRISKEGDPQLRRSLVQCAHIILGPRGRDSDLKRHGLKIMRAGGKDARRKAVIAVARKLAVLLHRLWSTGEVYQPLHNQGEPQPPTPARA